MASRREHTSSMSAPQLVLILTSLALLLIGLVMVYSASSIKAISNDISAESYLLDQLKYSVLGIAAAGVAWKVLPYRRWVGMAIRVIWVLSIILIVLTAAIGSAEYGAQRWLVLGPVSFQPSEFAKVVMILMAGETFADFFNQQSDLKTLIVRLLVDVGLPLAIILGAQSDLGTTAIIGVGILAVMWFGEVRPIIVLGIFLAVIAFVAVAILGTEYRSDRLVYLDPWNDGENGYGSGYNMIRSYYAFAEGGLFGVGLGNSHEKYLYLFASESDFIFAIIGEELGMIGALFVIALFMAFLWAGLTIAQNASDMNGRIIAGGLTVMLVFQAFLNIGCVIGVFPTTGKPLPFISSGGSSMIATLIMVGLILSVADGSSGPSVYEQRRANLRVVRSR